LSRRADGALRLRRAGEVGDRRQRMLAVEILVGTMTVAVRLEIASVDGGG